MLFSVLKIYLMARFCNYKNSRTLSIFIQYSIFEAYYIRIILLNLLHLQKFDQLSHAINYCSLSNSQTFGRDFLYLNSSPHNNVDFNEQFVVCWTNCSESFAAPMLQLQSAIGPRFMAPRYSDCKECISIYTIYIDIHFLQSE